MLPAVHCGGTLSRLDIPGGPTLNQSMSRCVVGWVVALLVLPGPVWAVEAAPALTDREIVERLTRLEEGQNGLRDAMQQLRTELGQLRTELGQLRTELGQLRTDMTQQNQQLREDMNRQNQQLREDMTRQNQQLREDMDRQFARQFRLTLALLGAFSALVAAIIGFALWDRRTMLRPLERTVSSLAEDLSSNRRRMEALVDALRALGQRNPEVAGVLKQFNLL